MAIKLSDPLSCQKCDKTLYSKVLYNFHIKNSHSVTSQASVTSSLLSSNQDVKDIFKSDSVSGTDVKAEQNSKPEHGDSKSRVAQNENAKEILDHHTDQMHSDEAQFECNLCQKIFGSRKNLKTHIDGVHASVKKFKCHLCDKSFTLASHRRVHIRGVHEKVRPYKCPVCETSFLLKDGLTQHIRTVHEEVKPHICSVCSKSFAANG